MQLSEYDPYKEKFSRNFPYVGPGVELGMQRLQQSYGKHVQITRGLYAYKIKRKHVKDLSLSRKYQ